MKASMIFTSNDVIINIGVIVAGVLVLLTQSKYPDLIIGAIVFLIVVRGGFQDFKTRKIDFYESSIFRIPFCCSRTLRNWRWLLGLALAKGAKTLVVWGNRRYYLVFIWCDCYTPIRQFRAGLCCLRWYIYYYGHIVGLES